MAGPLPPRIVVSPSPKQMSDAFDAYTTSVGRVAHAWNYFHEELAILFARIVGGCGPSNPQWRIALAVWYSSANDRAERKMLEDAIKAAVAERKLGLLTSKTGTDLLWLIKKANYLGDRRDEAIHAPCSLFTGPDGTEMGANIRSGHRRAKGLSGKQVLTEFDWLERYIEALSRFTHCARLALMGEHATWPEIPPEPTRQPRKTLQGLLRRLPSE